MSSLLELHVWLKIALGFCVLVALFVAFCWAVVIYDYVQLIRRFKR